MSEVTFGQVSSAILDGSLDDDMKEIEFAIKNRKDYLKQRMMRRLCAGDTVRVDHIRPKAICGLKAKVSKVNRTTISVVFGDDAGRYSGICRVPASYCEKVVKDAPHS